MKVNQMHIWLSQCEHCPSHQNSQLTPLFDYNLTGNVLLGHRLPYGVSHKDKSTSAFRDLERRAIRLRLS